MKKLSFQEGEIYELREFKIRHSSCNLQSKFFESSRAGEIAVPIQSPSVVEHVSDTKELNKFPTLSKSNATAQAKIGSVIDIQPQKTKVQKKAKLVKTQSTKKEKLSPLSKTGNEKITIESKQDESTPTSQSLNEKPRNISPKATESVQPTKISQKRNVMDSEPSTMASPAKKPKKSLEEINVVTRINPALTKKRLWKSFFNIIKFFFLLLDLQDSLIVLNGSTIHQTVFQISQCQFSETDFYDILQKHLAEQKINPQSESLNHLFHVCFEICNFRGQVNSIASFQS